MAKRKRATKEDIARRYDAIMSFAFEHKQVTVRGIYYHLTTLGLIPKTEAGYQKVARDCRVLRMKGDMPFDWIADSTRWMRKENSFGSVESFLDNTVRTYRRDLMLACGLDIEVWLEKDALSGVFYPVTEKYDIPLMVSRGFASLTFLHSAALQLTDGAFIYIFTDYDAAGAGIEEKIAEGLREFSNKTIHVKRAMLSREQVVNWNLPTRDPKANDMKRGYDFCAELDAVPPSKLREEVEACITEHVSSSQLNQLREIEALERDSIMTFAKSFNMS